MSTDTAAETPFRRATDGEIAAARAWVEHISSDWADSPDRDNALQEEYEHALEILVFANGGRHQPVCAATVAAGALTAWLDTETTGVGPDRRAWEVAAIHRLPGHSRVDDSEHRWFVDIADLDLPNADPVALEVGGFWRRHPQAHLVPLVGNLADVIPELPATPPQEPVHSEFFVLTAVRDLTAGKARIHGSNPGFDTETLATRMRMYGLEPDWHYHPEDVPGIARGWLLGRGNTDPPRKSDQISMACGVDPTGYGRHEALGDCRWLRDLYDVIHGPADIVEFARLVDVTAKYPAGASS